MAHRRIGPSLKDHTKMYFLQLQPIAGTNSKVSKNSGVRNQICESFWPPTELSERTVRENLLVLKVQQNKGVTIGKFGRNVIL